MTSTFATAAQRRCCWAARCALAASVTGAQAQEELRIGFLAPTTGIFAQVGKDMVDGFQMYLDEVKSDFGGAKVKFIVEDEQGKPDTAVTKAKKLILQDKVHMFVGGLLASTGYALAPVSTSRQDGLRRPGRGGRRPDAARPAEVSLPDPHQLDELAAEPSVRPMGLRAGLQEDRRHRRRLRLRLRGGRRLPARVRGLRRSDRPEDLAAARHQGLRAVHPDHQGGRRRDLLADGRPDVAAVPQAARGLRQQEAGDRRRHQL